MTDNFLWRIATRLNPQIKQLEGQQQFFTFIEMIPVLFTAPFAPLGLIWLIFVTDFGTLVDHALVLLVLTAVITLVGRRAFTIYIENEQNQDLPTTSSLGSIVLWSAALIYGPDALWMGVVFQVAWMILTAYQMHRLGRSMIWQALSGGFQGLQGYLFTPLIGLLVFDLLGGTHPPAGLHVEDVLPAAVAIAVYMTSEIVLIYPVIRTLNHMMGIAKQPGVRRWWLTIWAMQILTSTFSLLVALIYVEGGVGLYLFTIAGVVVVNFLAYYLSETNNRSRQRSRELAQLEALGEAIIQAPPDMSSLADILNQFVPQMFPGVRLEIRIFEPDAGSAWRGMRLIYPDPDAPPVDDAAWEKLVAADAPYIVERDVTPRGMRAAYGDVLLVKILDAIPDDVIECQGGIAILRRRASRTLDALAATQALASQIASALYRATVHAETLAAQKMAQELALAGRIQAQFLPAQVPQVPGWDIAAGLTPAQQTSGDFYDFVPLDDDRLGIVVADVADKGTGAALFMALSRTLIRTFALQHPDDPARALQLANHRILTDAASDQFVTVFYAILHPDGELVYANAGHNPAFIVPANSADPRPLEKTGIPLGMFDDMAWDQARAIIAPGDTLLLYTDGVSEAQNAANDEFGETRMIDAARAAPEHHARAVHATILAAVREFVAGAPQFDDITLLVARRT